MVRKGNILKNGDLEEGVVAPFTLATKIPDYGTADASINNVEQRSGSYCLALTSAATGLFFKGHTEKIDFEEAEVYQLQLASKKGTAYGCYPAIEFHDTADKYVDFYYLDVHTLADYQLTRGVLTNLGGCDHFHIMLGLYLSTANTTAYFDDIMLKPLRNYKSFKPERRKDYGAQTATFTNYPRIIMGGSFNVWYKYAISSTGGTTPTLDIAYRRYALANLELMEQKNVPQITADGTYMGELSFTAGGLLDINFVIGGTTPTFSIVETWQLVPL